MADSTSRFGFVAFAETWNGRLAMLGFVIGLGTELLTGQGILTQIGLGRSPRATGLERLAQQNNPNSRNPAWPSPSGVFVWSPRGGIRGVEQTQGRLGAGP